MLAGVGSLELESPFLVGDSRGFFSFPSHRKHTLSLFYARSNLSTSSKRKKLGPICFIFFNWRCSNISTLSIFDIWKAWKEQHHHLPFCQRCCILSKLCVLKTYVCQGYKNRDLIFNRKRKRGPSSIEKPESLSKQRESKIKSQKRVFVCAQLITWPDCNDWVWILA